ncbi:nitrate transporter [Saccharata proteae CBS 121410]|uniref:Nitrate/nitrite transporter n=1 Tax=Saccharata proteae CBS 121410 TaxID=1314787 RepID=A0A9P4LUW1_9PEZI|nr:nitrate transporter [Saccharata proteae CBS 121410]
MFFNPALLFRAPAVNPVNRKARTIPALNPVNMYGRVFFFSWFGFMIAFWSWYAFPPLLSDIIKKDLGLSQVEIANSNIIALVATLLVRLVAGTCCDHFGPRWTFAGCLLIGAIPTFLAGAVYNSTGLIVLRFFIGILGGSFVPCQVWTTGFFDKNIVGTANSLTGGLGNMGGGITYFVMPAIYNSLVSDGLKPHVAWRVDFVVPGVLIVAVALCLLLLCDDCPTGKWSERQAAAEAALRSHSVHGGGGGGVVDVPGSLTDERKGAQSPSTRSDMDEKKSEPACGDHEAQIGEEQMLEAAKGEVVQKPSLKETVPVIFSASTLVVAACYFCTFGAELSINSILANYYAENFKSLTLQDRGNWAAMFGLLNGVCRPLGGVVADLAYNRSGGVWGKKALLHTYSIIMGGFLIAIGLLDPHDQSTMFGLVAGMAFFLEGANGLNFSLVPHVHPYANGIVSGVTGASGNLGGIVFAIIFRYNGLDYAKVFWIIGVIAIAINLAVCWIKPIPRGQIGGH